MSTTGRRTVARPDRLVGASLWLVLAAFVLVAALAPGVPSTSDRAGNPDRWTCVDAARALVPTPSSALVQTGRARPGSRAATTGHGPCVAVTPLPVGKSGVVAPSVAPGPRPATAAFVRRRGPPSQTS